MPVGVGAMKQVTLISTVHAESGLASIAELQAILDRMRPEVIFAEVSASEVNQYRDGSHGTLESAAVARLRTTHESSLVPVDLRRPSDEFFRDAEVLFDAVERASPDYRRMMDQHSADVRECGFRYLNSERCVQAWAGIYSEVWATVEWLRTPRWREIYQDWCDTNRCRDEAMIRAVHEYCASHSFERGVLLVGAAHRASLMDKARSAIAAAPCFNWSLAELVLSDAP